MFYLFLGKVLILDICPYFVLFLAKMSKIIATIIIVFQNCCVTVTKELCAKRMASLAAICSNTFYSIDKQS